eukprot:264266-Chlamydomonas_euryale.AAC.2
MPGGLAAAAAAAAAVAASGAAMRLPAMCLMQQHRRHQVKQEPARRGRRVIERTRREGGGAVRAMTGDRCLATPQNRQGGKGRGTVRATTGALPRHKNKQCNWKPGWLHGKGPPRQSSVEQCGTVWTVWNDSKD